MLFSVVSIVLCFKSIGPWILHPAPQEWYFQPSLSLPLSSTVTTVDVPVLATAEYGRGVWAMEWANSALFSTRQGLFVEKTARQILFEVSREEN